MSEWGLAVAVLVAAATVATLIQRIVSQLAGHIDTRFAEAEANRRLATESWTDRMSVRDQVVDRLVTRIEYAASEHREIHQRIDMLQRQIAESYVTREAHIEEAGRNLIKLDKILDRLNQLDPKHG